MDKRSFPLDGDWYVALDEKEIGIKEKWFESTFTEKVKLPGTLDENGIGSLVTGTDTFRLNRIRKYVGAAWYNRLVVLPDDIVEKHVTLFLERCMWKTELWINGNYAGSQNSLSTPHKYKLDGMLKAGENLISIKVDNSPIYNLGVMSHGYSEEVQTVWNGIVGRIELDIRDKVYVERANVYSDMESSKLSTRLLLVNTASKAVEGLISLSVRPQDGENVIIRDSYYFSIGANSSVNVELTQAYEDKLGLWDEFNQNLYRMDINLECQCEKENEMYSDSSQILFGIRSFKAEGPVFRLNGKKIFLRGTHDAGNFPITGYPSMEVEDWKRIYAIAKSYGINHFRFHSWCPGEAAFAAADEEGMILQAELPLFGFTAPPLGQDEPRDSFLREELLRILEEYGNHPSFCMMCMGNELRGDYEMLSEFVEMGRKTDGRHLYSSAANNAAEPGLGIKPNKGDQYYVAHEARINGERVNRRCENVFNNERPETISDYSETLKGIEVPTISHEVGQWEVYPDFEEIKKYTGVLKAKNFEEFKGSAAAKQVLNKNKDFVMASGKLAVLLYREEIERSLRTADYGGFQLLDMHDFPGQGTALVGWLDAFWDSKGLVEPREFRNWCNHSVLLARMEKRVWLNSEVFSAEINFANYSQNDYSQLNIRWELTRSDGTMYSCGKFNNIFIPQGNLSYIGVAAAELNKVETAEKLILTIVTDGICITNQWDIWVYPEKLAVEMPEDIYVAESWDDGVSETLGNGGTVLMFTGAVRNSEAMCFTTPFWNTQMFENQRKTMGILCNPNHPALLDFPTEYHTNWQWWELLADSKCIGINELPAGFEPIVSAIDHPVRNNRLGVIFEARVLSGKLLICSLDLNGDLGGLPAARQLKYSILNYIQSERFEPEFYVDESIMANMLLKNTASNLKLLTKNIKASNTKYSSKVEYILDTDTSNFWVTMGGQYPYVIDIELTESTAIKGLTYWPRQDGMTIGLISRYEIYISGDPVQYGKPVASGSFKNTLEKQEIILDWIDDGFNVTRSKTGKYIRFVAVKGFNNDREAAIGSLDIITV
ncbi:sugar-binding domain-containing protein [Ruminiclostridium cellulolyticum]|uniref:Glycoside hydrolase family 2 sugar binding n=1 Tax=Ruminiclostridium cellulolyticum (strain ATCC 35319 / DSM 5812 / JCM 6584 / H10) TaxID=394503 RepID=B8I994_RUMCH|nr:sugar-binding domain-containing protein [Ruminiclostridium cellulolyticum]ACL75354.1 glycoside hydrolase family 2 sugar binding [Ruminiclostridium cellulolyticum H10]